MITYVVETNFRDFWGKIKKDFRSTFRAIGRENENILVIGILLEKTLLISLDNDENYTRHYNVERSIFVSVCTEHVPNICYDVHLHRKLQKDDRIHRLRDEYGIPITVDVISGIERIPIEGKKITKKDVINYLYGNSPLNPNFKIIYTAKNFLSSNSSS